jgi:hypothetical protein
LPIGGTWSGISGFVFPAHPEKRSKPEKHKTARIKPLFECIEGPLFQALAVTIFQPINKSANIFPNTG